MKRKYLNTTKKKVNFFTGIEVENSPAYKMQTLFVVGIQNIKTIINHATENNCKHIYLGANQSFKIKHKKEWLNIISKLLDHNLYVTLDLDIKHANFLLENNLQRRNKFIPMLSVKIPNIGKFNFNTCIKLDDIGFNKTNHGVWVHNLFSLESIEKFTGWTEYSKDEVIDHG